MNKPITDDQALKAVKVLLEYYRELGKKLVLDEFCDLMVVRLNTEVERLSKKCR